MINRNLARGPFGPIAHAPPVRRREGNNMSKLLSLILSSLFALAIVKAEAQLELEVEEADGLGKPKPNPCGCAPIVCPPNPTCRGPRDNFANYLNVNMDIADYYNFQTSFPDIGTGWALYGPPGTSYANGVFTSLGPNNYIIDGASVAIESDATVYFTGQLQFESVNNVATTLGADNDPFYGSGYLGVQDDVTTGLEFAFVLTNKTVYALYARSPSFRTGSNNYFAFRYLVPISSRIPNDHNVYTMGLNRAISAVTWMINGVIKMQITRVGQQIDNRFALNNYGGNQPLSVFPAAVKPKMGIVTFTDPTTHTACQATIYNYCDRTQSLLVAANNICAYAPIPDPGYQVTMSMIVDLFSISSASLLPSACDCRPLSNIA